MNPHIRLDRLVEPPVDSWQCIYCKSTGTYNHLRSIPCTHVYPPCPHCGEAPECARDCSGMIAILTDPRVYVAGGPIEPGD